MEEVAEVKVNDLVVSVAVCEVCVADIEVMVGDTVV